MEHGTLAGYAQHLLRHEVACDGCLAAQRRYQRGYSFRSGRTHNPVRCRMCGSVFPEHGCSMDVVVW